MKRPRVGFYVHYHGLGHKHRTEAVLHHLQLPACVITSRIHRQPWKGATLQEVVGIDCDVDDVPAAGRRRAQDVSTLHYAPLWTPTCTRRVAQYTAWIERVRPAVVVVDVSVEISLLTRLASIPQIVVRQHGDRSDAAHASAYQAAESLLAPFPESMEDDITPQWVREKTVYLDGFCRTDGPTPSRERARAQLDLDPQRNLVVVLFGRGGDGQYDRQLCEAAAATPNYDWIVVGVERSEAAFPPANLRYAGWVSQPDAYLRAADVVVTAAGHNSVMEAGFARSRFVAIAEPRPFDEQLRKTVVLQREGLAVGCSGWPDDAAQWPQIIEQARQLDPQRWDAIYRGDGALQAARHIESIASRPADAEQVLATAAAARPDRRSTRSLQCI